MRFLCSIALLLILPSFLAAEVPIKLDAQRLNSGLLAGVQKNSLPQPLTSWRMVRDSALIFSGTVLSVEHLRAGPNNAPGITRISFRVQNAIRGTRRGQVIQIREWDGLWNAGERYQRGENVLLFLYPKSKLGLTSPVGGRNGRFRVDKSGRIEAGKGHDFFKSSTFHGQSVDVRKFAAEIRRTARE